MAEHINANLEKAFMTYIFQHPTNFLNIEPKYFENESIRFIYTIIRDEYLTSKEKYIPSSLQIATMVRANDPNKEKIQDDILKFILRNDNTDYNEEYLEKRFKAWKLSKSLRSNILKSVDDIRSLSDIDYDNVVDVVAKIKSMYSELSLVEQNEIDLGADFDDPESHKQDLAVNKISTGWRSLDQVTGGGWDLASLVVIMGETNIGKCIEENMIITIKNKKSDIIEHIKIGEFYKKLKNN